MLNRLMAFFLAVLMVLTLCVPALADEPSPDTPAATEAAGPAGTPDPGQASEATAGPEATEAPEATEDPESTEDPEPTEDPELTEDPEPTEGSETTDEPEPADDPEPTEDPEPTDEPEATEEPLSEEDDIMPLALDYTPDTEDKSFANLVLFVYFQDQKDGGQFFQDRSGQLHDLYDGTGNLSFTKYLDIISGGQLKVLNLMPQYQDGTIAAFQLPHNSTDSISDYNLIQSALKKLAETSSIPAETLDLNGDGAVDNVTVIVRGGDGLTPTRGMTASIPSPASWSAPITSSIHIN